MPDCSYCGASFDDEESYLRHLGDEHDDELGRIDRRRVRSLERDGGVVDEIPVGGVVLVGIIGIAAVVGFLVVDGGGGDETTPAGIEAERLPASGDPALLANVTDYPGQSREHVGRSTPINYSTYPPTGGPHYGRTAPAGVYNRSPSAGDIVHTLEHGAVVIYYDEAGLTPEIRRSLEEWAAAYTGTWMSILAVPHTRESPESPFVLTAWGHMLRMDEYDPEVVQAFAAEYLGRGPENPVR